MQVQSVTTRGQDSLWECLRAVLARSSVLQCFASLKLAQVVVKRLDIGEDTHGVRFTSHYHHVVHLDQTVTARFGLCRPEGQFKVVFPVGGGQGGVVELSGEEGVDQRTEGQAIAPTRREVLDFYVLVSDGLGAAPLQKHLFDAAGAGNAKTLRAL